MAKDQTIQSSDTIMNSIRIFRNSGNTLLTVLWLVVFLANGTSYGQDTQLSEKIAQLKSEIARSRGGEKLMLMDSLSQLTEGKKGVGYEAAAKSTIDYALELDSTRLALIHAKSLVRFIYYDMGQLERANAIFADLKHKIPKRNKDYLELANFYLVGGDSYERTGLLDKAVATYQEALDQAQKTNDSLLLGITKNEMGDALCYMGDFQRAAPILQESIQILTKHSPRTAWEPKRTLAILYSQNGFQEQAKALRLETLVDAQLQKNYDALYGEFYNQAYDEMLHGSQEERIRNLDSARSYVELTESELSFQEVLVGQLSAYSENGMLEKAIIVKKELEEKRKNSNAALQVDEYDLAMGQFEFAMGNYAAAATWGEKEYDLVKNTNVYERIYAVNHFLSKVYGRLGNHKKALDHFKTYSRIKDSIESVQKANGFIYFQTLYNTEKKDAEIAIHKSEIELLDSQNKEKRQLILFGGFGALAGFIIVILLYSRNFNLKKRKLQAEFSRNLIKSREDQCTHVSRELHDSVGQKLMLLTKKIKTSGNRNEIEVLATDTLEELRSISRGLHPGNLELLGFTKAVEVLVNEIDANTDIFFTNEIEDIDDILCKESEIHVYRIIQEALNNMVKHAQAKVASVKIEKKDNAIKIMVVDNGKGFEFSSKLWQNRGLGMKTILERAKIINSHIHVNSASNKGTIVELVIPLRF